MLLEIEANQQIRGEADALPAYKHEQKILRQHQRQHEEHEEIEIGKERPVALLVRHITDRVDVDEEADAGDDQQHDQRELIKRVCKIRVKGRGGDPRRVSLNVGKGGRRETGVDTQDQQKRRSGEDQPNRRDQRLRQAMAEQAIQQKADKGQNRNKPEMEAVVHSFIKFTWSTLSVFRARKIAMMMASPTAASAAATTMTKKTKTCPL